MVLKKELKMDKKRKFKIACSCVITICLSTVFLRYLTDLMELKISDTKFAPFLEQDEDFDVLFMGSSHVNYSIYPMELWNDFGIVSYNMAADGAQIPTSYWVIENALEQTTPKLVVVDCYNLRMNVKSAGGLAYVHNSYDAMPLNITKLKAVWDQLDDPEAYERQPGEEANVPRKRMELIWNYSIYHARWNELSKNDFVVPRNRGKGATLRVAVAAPDDFEKISSENKWEGEPEATVYLRKMIEDCQNRGIEIMLIYVPFPAEEAFQKEANRVYDIADEYGVDYLNFLDMDIVDYNTDCLDSNSHLNVSGGQKITEYLGQYIVEHYNIPDQRNNPAYDSWYEDYRGWTEEKINFLKSTESLDVYLMLLADRHFEAEIEINNPAIREDEYYARLLKNAHLDGENYETAVETGDDSEEEDTPDVCITVKDPAIGEIIDYAEFHSGIKIDNSEE